MKEYHVTHLKTDHIHVKVPGSKSITNRALLIASLACGTSVIKGTLASDDSRHFLDSLVKLGINVSEDKTGIIIKGTGGIIPEKNAEIDVGSAGTAARFLTAMLALSDGEYAVNASPQMQKRPMAELLCALEDLGAKFEYMNEDHALPFRVTGRKNPKIFQDSTYVDSVVSDSAYAGNSDAGDTLGNVSDSGNTGMAKHPEYLVSLNIDRSSQFLSALLMTAPMLDGPLTIELTGKRTARSYVGITINMMKDFGVYVENPSEDVYTVKSVDDPLREDAESDRSTNQRVNSYVAREYMCEPDVSAACYYYAMAAVTGKEAVVDNIYRSSMQGDIRFVDILEKMGCMVRDMPEGVSVKGTGRLTGIDVDMSDCSDQTMTLAAIAPYADSPVTIRGVGHIRKQESDRIAAVADALSNMGVGYEEYEDGIKIMPGIPNPAHINTYEDHRMAMAFAVTGLCTEGIVINDPDCCAKTFPEYFKILDSLTDKN